MKQPISEHHGHLFFLIQITVSKAQIQPLPLLQQLSHVLCHSLLEHWLVLWCTTVLWRRNPNATRFTPWQNPTSSKTNSRCQCMRTLLSRLRALNWRKMSHMALFCNSYFNLNMYHNIYSCHRMDKYIRDRHGMLKSMQTRYQYVGMIAWCKVNIMSHHYISYCRMPTLPLLQFIWLKLELVVKQFCWYALQMKRIFVEIFI